MIVRPVTIWRGQVKAFLGLPANASWPRPALHPRARANQLPDRRASPPSSQHVSKAEPLNSPWLPIGDREIVRTQVSETLSRDGVSIIAPRRKSTTTRLHHATEPAALPVRNRTAARPVGVS